MYKPAAKSLDDVQVDSVHAVGTALARLDDRHGSVRICVHAAMEPRSDPRASHRAPAFMS